MIGSLVAAFARRRRARFAAQPRARRSLGRPVISVGNMSFGGTGKTPLVACVARLLQQAGHKPAVLSRGYARPRPLDGAVVVSDGQRVLATYDTAGDEPLMLARQLPGCAVVVSPDRFLAGTLAERRLRCTVHILDDGFQHLQLSRAADVVVVRRTNLEDSVMPAGRLREPLDALHVADAVVVYAEEAIEDAVRRAGARRVFRITRRLGPVRPEPAFAFAGIGQPGGFFDSLRAGGWALAGTRAFPDHHRYSERDLARLAAAAARTGARVLVTTEKDMVRLDALRVPAMPVIAVPLEIAVDPPCEFAAFLRQAAGDAAAEAGAC